MREPPSEFILLNNLYQNAGIELPAAAVDKIIELWHLVENVPFNVTAIQSFAVAAHKHLLDCLMLLRYAQPQGKLIDVGTGGGFPGLPLAIACPALDVTLLDATAKKAHFCDEAAQTLGLANAHGLAGRAEELAREPEYRERYDVCVSRAVAGLSELCELCLPLVKVGGMFYAYKGAAADDEVAAAQNAIKALGGMLEAVEHYTLPNGDARAIVVIRKHAPTGEKYPRAYAQISKKPL